MRCRAMLLLFVILSLPRPAFVRAQDEWQLVVLTVDQDQQPIEGACFEANPEEMEASTVRVFACDADDGRSNGSATLRGFPAQPAFQISMISVPRGCLEQGIKSPFNSSNDHLPIELHCQTASTPGTDLAGFMLRPADVPQAGWTHDGAFFDTLDAYSRNEADYRSHNTAPGDVSQALSSAGWNRYYSSSLSHPSSVDPSAPGARIRSYITEYTSASGAAEGFTYLEDESLIPSAADVQTSRAFGDQSELTTDHGMSSVEGVEYRALDLTFRVDNLVAGVTLIVYQRGTTVEPDAQTVEALAAIVESRLTSPAADPKALGNALNRMVTPFDGVATYDDAYYRWNGTDIPLTGENSTAAANRIETYADATDVYQLWQGVDVETANGFLYGVTLLHFPTETAAQNWTTNLQTILEANPFYANMRALEEVDLLGDQVTALSYSAGGGADTPRAILIAVRVGNNVARVHVVPQGRLQDIPLAPVVELAEMEAGCLSGSVCSTLVPVPEGLLSSPPSR